MQEYFHLVVEFNKLEKVEYGGSKGQTFSEKTEQMFTSFVELTQRIQQKSCDPLDTASDVSYKSFHSNSYII